MPGPKMPRASIESAASTIAMASSIVGSPANPAVNSPKMVEPMPTITASTRTLTPDEITSPNTRSAMKAVLLNRPKGTRMKPASVASLNSISVTKSWIARMKKDRRTTSQAKSRMMIWRKFSKKETKPIRSEIDARIGRPASRPISAMRPG